MIKKAKIEKKNKDEEVGSMVPQEDAGNGYGPR
jgi:hypothetical protein